MNHAKPYFRAGPAAFLLTVALALLGGAVSAQEYNPDVYEFDGSNSMVFPAAAQLNLSAGGTIEFWVAPDWQADPGYDPVVLCNAGPDGAAYLIALLAERDGLIVTAGDQEDYFAFDFTDAELHHVAVSQLEDGIVVMVDGQTIGVSELRFADLPTDSLWVGSINGEDQGFIGAVAALRMWNRVIEKEELVDYALRDIFDSDHPDIESLAAISDFANRELLIVEAVETN